MSNEKDSVTEAPESGEPAIAGRSQGQILTEKNKEPAGLEHPSPEDKPQHHNDPTGGESGKVSQATESGRQRAVPER